MNTRLYFAYGSNLDRERFLARCPTSTALTWAIWDGMELEFRGVATIVPRHGGKAYGALYEIGPKDEDALDAYEGVATGFYTKQYADFKLPNGRTEQALWYEMSDARITAPTLGYLGTIIKGYRDWKLPLRALRLAVVEAQRADEMHRRFQRGSDNQGRRDRRARSPYESPALFTY